MRGVLILDKLCDVRSAEPVDLPPSDTGAWWEKALVWPAGVRKPPYEATICPTLRPSTHVPKTRQMCWTGSGAPYGSLKGSRDPKVLELLFQIRIVDETHRPQFSFPLMPTNNRKYEKTMCTLLDFSQPSC